MQPLTIGELWAVPIALRVVLVENLRRLAERIVQGRAARHEADALANELLGLGGQPARPLAFQRLEAAALTTAFTVQLVQRLREQDPESTPALSWLDTQLSALGTSPDELVRVEHQSQAAMNVTVRNVITSMRTMATVEWVGFFESVSLVDELLRADSRFGDMDFATRDQYRHAIEDLARGSQRSELDVTRRAIARATRAADAARGVGAPPGDRAEDPGYYLISKGRRLFEEEIDYRVPARRWLFRAYASRGDAALPRKHWYRDGVAPGRPAPGGECLGGKRGRARRAGLGRAHPRLGPRRRHRQPDRHGRARPEPAAAPRAPRRGPAAPCAPSWSSRPC